MRCATALCGLSCTTTQTTEQRMLCICMECASATFSSQLAGPTVKCCHFVILCTIQLRHMLQSYWLGATGRRGHGGLAVLNAFQGQDTQYCVDIIVDLCMFCLCLVCRLAVSTAARAQDPWPKTEHYTLHADLAACSSDIGLAGCQTVTGFLDMRWNSLGSTGCPHCSGPFLAATCSLLIHAMHVYH